MSAFNYAKKNIKNILCISGGPNIPLDKKELKQYLSSNKQIDFCVLYEGEIPFANIILEYIKTYSITNLKNSFFESSAYLDKESNLVYGPIRDRITNLDSIPSPYLTGLLDEWFTGNYAPSIETVRGCPFSCAFCYGGLEYLKND